MSRLHDGSDQGQPSTRRPGTIYDNHVFPGHPLFSNGRPWECSIDKKSGYPVGVIKPKGWRAPWRPPMGPETLIFDQNNPSRFRFNYERLLQERHAAATEYDDERTKAALVRGWDPMDPEKQNALDLIVGRRESLQPPQVVVACLQGDPWILGATDVVNKKLEPFVPKKRTAAEAIMSRYPDFRTESLADDVDALMDLQETYDPEETPRGTVPHKPTKQPRRKTVAPEAA